MSVVKNTSPQAGYIYAYTVDDLRVKCGHTTSPDPLQYIRRVALRLLPQVQIIGICQVPHSKAAESMLFLKLDKFRCHSSHELFEVPDLDVVHQCLQDVCHVMERLHEGPVMMMPVKGLMLSSRVVSEPINHRLLMFVFMGAMGTGKSTIINNILQKTILPVSPLGAGTKVPIVISYSPDLSHAQYAVTKQIVTWEKFQSKIADFCDSLEQGDVVSQASQEAKRELGQLYSRFASRKDMLSLLQRDTLGECDIAMIKTHMLNEPGLWDGYTDFGKSSCTRVSQDAIGNAIQLEDYEAFMVDEITIEVPHDILKHIKLVDLPGTQDISLERSTRYKNYLDQADHIFMVFKICRGMDTAGFKDVVLEITTKFQCEGKRERLSYLVTAIEDLIKDPKDLDRELKTCLTHDPQRLHELENSTDVLEKIKVYCTLRFHRDDLNVHATPNAFVPILRECMETMRTVLTNLKAKYRKQLKLPCPERPCLKRKFCETHEPGHDAGYSPKLAWIDELCYPKPLVDIARTITLSRIGVEFNKMNVMRLKALMRRKGIHHINLNEIIYRGFMDSKFLEAWESFFFDHAWIDKISYHLQEQLEGRRGYFHHAIETMQEKVRNLNRATPRWIQSQLEEFYTKHSENSGKGIKNQMVKSLDTLFRDQEFQEKVRDYLLSNIENISREFSHDVTRAVTC